MNKALLGASWLAVRRVHLFGPLAVAVLLVAVTLPALDTYGLHVLRGVGVVLAFGWLTTVDDPMGEVLGGSPYPRAVRTAARVLAGAVVVVPVWVVAAGIVALRSDGLPFASIALEAVAYGAAGLATAGALRAWAGHLTPSHVALPAMAVVAVLTDVMPRSHAMVQAQLWGPPWQAAQLRWSALLVLGLAVLVAALRDPMSTVRPERTTA